MLGFIKDLLTQNYFNKKAPDAFKNFYRYSTESEAFLAYCKELHGLEFPVQNNLSKDQFKFLLKVLKSSKPKTVLDLGCGSGHLFYFLKDKFGFSGKGIDFALKSNKDLIGADFEKHYYTKSEFDIIYSIDSLYMINDLKKMISKLNGALKDSGKIVIFYTSTKVSSNSRLVKMLKKEGYRYQITDFTKDDYKFWKQSLKLLESSKSDFIKEGNSNIWATKFRETKKNIELQDASKLSRFAIIVSKK